MKERDLTDMKVTEIAFITTERWDQKIVIAVGMFEDVVHVGNGETRQEAVESLFKNTFPELKNIEYSDRVKMQIAMRGGM